MMVRYFLRFKKFGNEEKYGDYLMPTIIDLPGLENENGDLQRELLKIVFYGRLPEGERFVDVQR